jgi:hypothetical protein
MRLLALLFGCSHPRTTFPITPGRRGFRTGTYVVCLDCGKEFHYFWPEMKRGSELVRWPRMDNPSLSREPQAGS